jgi:hypothetical protein
MRVYLAFKVNSPEQRTQKTKADATTAITEQLRGCNAQSEYPSMDNI